MSPDNTHNARRWLCAASVLLLPLTIAQAQDQAQDQSDAAVSSAAQTGQAPGAKILQQSCQACHLPAQRDDGSTRYSRISDQRKTPEGWRMTINRMIHLRGVALAEADIAPLVQYLADTQGLAPSEAAPYRYLLEQDTNRAESGLDPELETMCARCHSGARVALQRRTEQEWQYLVNFHMAQFPTTELQAFARDRPWYRIAHDEVAPRLAERYGFDNAAWQQWLDADKPALEGDWRLVGHLPRRGDFDARMSAIPQDDGSLALRLDGTSADGSVLTGQGTARIYSGYEWRGELDIDGTTWRQVLATDGDGKRLQGRMFRADMDVMGGPLRAIRADAAAEVLSVSPSYLKRGDSTEITIVGQHLDGEPSLGAGIAVLEILDRDADGLRLRVQAASDATLGPRDVGVGEASLGQSLVVYDKLARLEVEPANAVARIGGNAGPLAKMPVPYRAIGYAAGPDGKAGSDDDLRLGYMPVTWSIAPADEIAEHEQDAQFAGGFDEHGVFVPGDAGPNPERPKRANNVGRLKAIATREEGGETITASGRLIVAVQDYVKRVIE
ncbi:quinohemoprotein amine dehydrogenase subunit alpha [Halomonas sp. V046]|uniref:quinohemoprotein amine dehydrogenase subunit alpha n=1 Tax=Halomonas sp. V046 TaxID=3459611 RepID=UPI004044C392